MMCSIFESIAYNVRETDDLLNPVGAGALTGVIYKITSVRGQTLCPGRTGHAARAPSPSAPLRDLHQIPPGCVVSLGTECLSCAVRARESRSPQGSDWERWLPPGRF